MTADPPGLDAAIEADDVVPASLISAPTGATPQPGDKNLEEAFEKARAAYDSVVILAGAAGHRRGHHDAMIAAVRAAAPALRAGALRDAAKITNCHDDSELLTDMADEIERADRIGGQA